MHSVHFFATWDWLSLRVTRRPCKAKASPRNPVPAPQGANSVESCPMPPCMTGAHWHDVMWRCKVNAWCYINVISWYIILWYITITFGIIETSSLDFDAIGHISTTPFMYHSHPFKVRWTSGPFVFLVEPSIQAPKCDHGPASHPKLQLLPSPATCIHLSQSGYRISRISRGQSKVARHASGM